jgi:hypothetical protein
MGMRALWALALLVVVVAHAFPEEREQSSVEILDGAEAAPAVQDLGETVGQAACTGTTPYIYNGGCVATCPGSMAPDPNGPVRPQAGENILLLNSADESKAVTYPGGFAALSGATGSAAQHWRINKYTGSKSNDGNILGDDGSNWADDASDNVALQHGDWVDLYNPDADKVYDCAWGACSHQPHPPPNGHWGTPYRVYKNGGTTGDVITMGDEIYFDRQLNGVYDASKGIACTDSGCSGVDIGSKTIFKIGDASSSRRQLLSGVGLNNVPCVGCDPSTPYAASPIWTNLQSHGSRCDEGPRNFGGSLGSLGACKAKCIELGCGQIDYKANGWCNTYADACTPDQASGGDWVALAPPAAGSDENVCVADCGPGEGPNAHNECQPCEDQSPYVFANHPTTACVNKCPSGTAPDLLDDCNACPSAKHVNRATDQCVDTCPEGLAPDDNNDCSPCVGSTPYSEVDGSGATSCVQTCAAGSAPRSDTVKHCVACSGIAPYADKTTGTHTCVARCSPGTMQDGNNECTACGGGTPYADYAAGQCVGTCPAGQAPNDDGDCQVCSSTPSPYADHAAHRCVDTCPDGQAPDGNGDCAACDGSADPKEYADHVRHQCVTTCLPGYAPNGAGNTCIQCASTSLPFADMANTACVDDCPVGQAPNTQGDCASCGDKYANHATNTCVETCPPGQTPNGDNDCEACGGSRPPYADHVAHQCVDTCPGASAPNAQNSCEACTEALPYADPAANACVDVCPQVQGPDDSNVCADCADPSPFWTPLGCVADCPKGQAPNDANVCGPCQGGTPFADHTPGSHACVAACPARHVQNDDKDCELCSGWRDMINIACVQECPLGPPGSGHDSIHKSNEGNAFVGDSNGDCVECPDVALPYGDYTAGACVANCPAGTFGNHNWACKACGTATQRAYADHNLKRCVDTCPSGFVPNSDNDCEACSGGTPYADHVAKQCVADCPAGSVVDDVTGVDCTVIPDQFDPATVNTTLVELDED